MEEVQKRHRQEQKDLQARIMQKRMSATKKTRKGVNDECATLERHLKEKQESEIFALTGESEICAQGDNHSVNEFPEDLQPHGIPEDLNGSMKSLSISSTPVTNGGSKKPNRQKARLARRAAEQEAAAKDAEKEAADIPNLRDREREAMQKAYHSRGLEEQIVRSDGHCLYAAVADQLEHSHVGFKPKIDINLTYQEIDSNHTTTGYKVTRHVAAAYISQNQDDFLPFLDQPLEEYVGYVRDSGEWGGHLELLALAKAYGVNIHVLQGDGSVTKVECGIEDESPSLWLAYYRHSFGLGEHYNSLRKIH